MSTLKVDLYPEEAYTFTPRGKVIVLPRDATPIDFAYAIHSDVGSTCVGAKVNGRIVPLRSTLRNGDIVEIMTQPGHEPSKDWLAFVKTSRARNKIKHLINAGERVKAIEIGQKYLEKEARRLGVQLSKVTKADMERVAGEYGLSKMEDLHAALGYGKFSARQVLSKIAPGVVKEEVPEPRPAPAADAGAALCRAGRAACRWRRCHQGPRPRRPAWCTAPSAAIRFAARPSSATSPAARASPYTPRMCPNVQSLMYDVERKIEVEWARAAEDSFPVRIVIHTDDRPGMLNQLTSVLSNENTNIRSLEAKGAHRSRWRRRGNDGRCARQETTRKTGSHHAPHLRRARRRTALQLKMIPIHRSRTHRHFQIERHQDRLEGWPSQRLRPHVPARQVPLRHLQRRPRHAPARAARRTIRSRCSSRR